MSCFKRVLAVGLSPREPAEGGLLNTLGYKSSAQWNAQLPFAGFKQEVPVHSFPTDGNLMTDLQAFARVEHGYAGPGWCQSGIEEFSATSAGVMRLDP